MRHPATSNPISIPLRNVPPDSPPGVAQREMGDHAVSTRSAPPREGLQEVRRWQRQGLSPEKP